MRALIIALALVGNLCALDLQGANPESYDWQAYVTAGANTYEHLDRIKEAVASLKARADGITKDYLGRVDKPARKLLLESQKKWEEYAHSRAAFISDQYRGGTLAGVSAGFETIRSYKTRILDLLSYDQIYFGP